MYLAAIDIKNFRSFSEMHVELQQGLNVLVGRNNTGKTNLLRAIRLALGPSASRGDSLWLDRDDFYKESATDATERTISVTLEFRGLTEEERAYFFEIVAFNLSDLPNSRAFVRFEAFWPVQKRQPSISRTGGPLVADPPEIPAKILESIPITFLPALRDAEAALAPGHRSRLASLLSDLTNRGKTNTSEAVTAIFSNANNELVKQPIIKDTAKSLQATTEELAGSDYASCAIRVAPMDFEKVLRTLQVQMDGVPIGDLDANGLGFNNLLYMAVVLEHLKQSDADESPLLLIEEPEAHLHPQLTVLLADYLTNKVPGKKKPQTIVTTHSPTLAAHVTPDHINILFQPMTVTQVRCSSIFKAGMDEAEQNQLQRMMDITRSALFFAKGAILVEGISEALLIPVLAKRLGYDFAALHISVIPICGVAFGTFEKLLKPEVFGIPIAIVTDADPRVPSDTEWKNAMPDKENGSFVLSERTQNVVGIFQGHETVKVFCSQLTLEYDLAEAGETNAALMAEVWEDCFRGTPGTFNSKLVNAAKGGRDEKALIAWRGICRAEHSGSKAEFAHRLASRIAGSPSGGGIVVNFEVPTYLSQAIEYVARGMKINVLNLQKSDS